MSSDAANLPCPICLNTGVFDTVQALKDRLIFVSTNNIMCPVCQEEVSGLDKLTIHLFSHVKFLTTKEVPSANKIKNIENHCHKVESKCLEQTRKSKTSVSKNKTASRTASPLKYVKIYPKLPVVALNTLPVIDISSGSGDGSSPNNQLFISTVKSDATIVQANKCNICGLQFVDSNILNMHKSLVHNLDDNSNHTITRYDCHLCPKNFKMRGSLMVHLRVAHFGFSSNSSSPTTMEKIESNGNSPTEKVNELERQDGKQWQCDVCRKCFTTKYFLKKHKRLHTGETPYACSQCNKTFTFQQSYHKHLLYHNDEKPHTCSFCGRSFKELSTLHNHQRIHTGEKPFACESCGKCFRQRVSYLVHRRIHTGAMPYKCTSCNKSFRYKVSQRTHKCQAQPPGTVVRKIGELVEKLKKKSTINETDDKMCNNMNFIEVSEANAELVRIGAKISLQDMESENFAIISNDIQENIISPGDSTKNIDQNQNLIQTLDELIDYNIPMNEKSIPSPSEILKNLCLTNSEEGCNDNKMYFQDEFNPLL